MKGARIKLFGSAHDSVVWKQRGADVVISTPVIADGACLSMDRARSESTACNSMGGHPTICLAEYLGCRLRTLASLTLVCHLAADDGEHWLSP